MDSGTLPHLREVLVFLALAGVLIPLLQRLRVNSVLGFLVAGVAVGPYGLARLAYEWPWLETITIPDREGVEALAEVGVVFLMFTIGLELSTERLWAIRRWVFGAGGLQVLACGLAIGGVAVGFGHSPAVATVLGLALAFSSTAIVMQLLMARREVGSPLGRATFAVLLFQDLAVVPALILAATLGGAGGPAPQWAIAIALAKGLVALGLIFWLGRKAVRPLFRRLAASRQADSFMALTLLSTLGIAALTWTAGLSMAMGAFLAGLLLAETEYRHELLVTIEPFRGLLMGLFFLSVGMGIDVREVMEEPVWLPLAVLGLFAVKGLLTAGILWRFGLAPARAVEAGLLLGQAGEFAFIVIGAAVASGLFADELAHFMMLTVALSMMVTPFAGRLAPWLRHRIERRHAAADGGAAELARAVPELEGHVMIAGYGRVGQMIAGVLDAQRMPYLAVDANAALVAPFHEQGVPLFVGDAGHPELLRSLHLDQAALVVLTMNEPEATLQATLSVRRANATIPILARAKNAQHATALLEAGATDVIQETLEASLQLTGSVLTRLGLPDDVADDLVDQERQRRQPERRRTRRAQAGRAAGTKASE